MGKFTVDTGAPRAQCSACAISATRCERSRGGGLHLRGRRRAWRPGEGLEAGRGEKPVQVFTAGAGRGHSSDQVRAIPASGSPPLLHPGRPPPASPARRAGESATASLWAGCLRCGLRSLRRPLRGHHPAWHWPSSRGRSPAAFPCPPAPTRASPRPSPAQRCAGGSPSQTGGRRRRPAATLTLVLLRPSDLLLDLRDLLQDPHGRALLGALRLRGSRIWTSGGRGACARKPTDDSFPRRRCSAIPSPGERRGTQCLA